MRVHERNGWAAIVAATVLVGGCGDEGAGSSTGVLEPCSDLSTGYEGDELCLEEPSPDEGFQLHFGPESYDEASMEPFLIYPGEENVECIYLNTPNDQEVWVKEFHGRVRPVSHHMITYVLDEDVEDNDLPKGCDFGDTSSTFLLGSQEPTVDISAEDAAPEHEGYALRIGPNQQARIELHYINTTSEPMLREAWINVKYADVSEVTEEMSPLFWIAELDKEIDPNAEDLMQGNAVVPNDADPNLELIQITGHFHAHTERMTAWLTDASRETPCTAGVLGEGADLDGCTRLYEGYDYTDPGWVRFDSIHDNPAPNPDQRVAGGDYDGNLNLEPGDRIDWECEIHNDLNDALPFANAAETAEMCNIFGTYAPSMGGDPWAEYNF
ncbi:MAG: hypothetical protein ACOCXM_05620 [Myxococcota bacterium]